MDELEYLQNLCLRFHGVSLDARHGGTDWPQPWRARLVATKNERDEYRVECFGATAREAIGNLRAIVAKLDSSHV